LQVECFDWFPAPDTIGRFSRDGIDDFDEQALVRGHGRLVDGVLGSCVSEVLNPSQFSAGEK
jgi:hypothetical protein